MVAPFTQAEGPSLRGRAASESLWDTCPAGVGYTCVSEGRGHVLQPLHPPSPAPGLPGREPPSPDPLTQEGHALLPQAVGWAGDGTGVDASGGQDTERSRHSGRAGGQQPPGSPLSPRLATCLPTWTAMCPSLSLHRHPLLRPPPSWVLVTERMLSSAPGRGRWKQRHKRKRGPTRQTDGFSLAGPRPSQHRAPSSSNPLSTGDPPALSIGGTCSVPWAECAALMQLRGLAQTQSLAQKTLDLPGNLEKPQFTASAQARRLSSVEQVAEVTERGWREETDPGEHSDIKNWEGKEEMEEETFKGGGEP